MPDIQRDMRIAVATDYNVALDTNGCAFALAAWLHALGCGYSVASVADGCVAGSVHTWVPDSATEADKHNALAKQQAQTCNSAFAFCAGWQAAQSALQTEVGY